MTKIGQIFTLLLLILSVGFFVASVAVNASHTDLRKKVADFQTRAQSAEKTIDELKKAGEATKSVLSQEQVSRRVALSALQSQLTARTNELAQANTKLNDLNSKNTEATQALAQTLAEQKRLESENSLLKTEIDKIITDRNGQRRTVIRLTDDLNGLRSLYGDLDDQVKLLQDQSTRYQAMAETRAAALSAAGVVDPEDVPPSDLKGVVLAVGSDQSIEISVGRDDGIREGHLLDIYRSGSYLGRIQIRTVADDKAVGKIIPAFRKGYIQAGDKVAAKIN